MKMLLNGTWGCRRYWYQGPPGARGCYRYRYTAAPFARPRLRFDRGSVLIGTGRNYLDWRWRWPR